MWTYDDNVVSDLHKDAFGFRPSEYWWTEWNLSDEAGKQDIWDGLIEALNAAIKQEQEQEERAIIQFEARIMNVMTYLGAATEEEALAILMEQDQADSLDHLCWINRLPYRYFQ